MFETDFNLVKCCKNPKECHLSEQCRFKSILLDSLEGFFAPLKQSSIADLVNGQKYHF
ncbi:hypothetical protein [Roseibium sp.]|uniref:hypothetical protein n=1 Tax=Roseibium sp. TaxID=1936156 RepID=UPI003B518389